MKNKNIFLYSFYFNIILGHFEIIKFLIEKGVNVNAKDVNNETGISIASDRGD